MRVKYICKRCKMYKIPRGVIFNVDYAFFFAEIGKGHFFPQKKSQLTSRHISSQEMMKTFGA